VAGGLSHADEPIRQPRSLPTMNVSNFKYPCSVSTGL
jgi:hypothetical protein